ncbi:UNVERIFIED_CONTAM: hypothetical protein GTU68_063021 [Idotea baltica]|nr:hypothetical protein [Idotea baltica]
MTRSEVGSGNECSWFFLERHTNFGRYELVFEISVDKHPVKVKAWYLAPETFGTVPMYFLSTDLPENDFLAQTICHRLYDSETAAKIAQYILLGQGGAKLLEILNYQPDKIHLNEAHALPAIFYDYYQHKDLAQIREKFVFTTHTPVEAGNETHSSIFLKKMGFFHDTPIEQIREIIGIDGDDFSLTLGALRLSGSANGVSKLHGEVARKMWSKYDGIPRIDHVTNSQHAGYWTDASLKNLMKEGDQKGFQRRKKELKENLFLEVANQTGKVFDPDILTIVWARRFAPYKRADLLTWDTAAFEDLLRDKDQPVQIIWAGKPYPMDYGAISVFNKLVNLSKIYPNIAVLVRYELALSKLLKQGSDIWLNTPRVTREASGTSGMTAAMNGSVNFTTYDGWIPEFAEHGKNAFVIPESNLFEPIEVQDQNDLKSAYTMLNSEIKPLYYKKKRSWLAVVKKSMADVVPFFDSSRMAAEYYKKLYSK